MCNTHVVTVSIPSGGIEPCNGAAVLAFFDYAKMNMSGLFVRRFRPECACVCVYRKQIICTRDRGNNIVWLFTTVVDEKHTFETV